MTQLPRWADLVLIPLLSLSLAFIAAGLVVAAVGENPFRALAVMVQGAFIYDGGLGYTLYYSTNFIFTGLAVSVAYKAMLFNIGGEGQAYLGGLGAIIVCLALDTVLPSILLVPIAIAGAAVFGALWALIPGWLQAYRGSHVVITTIMFNFIAAGLMVSLLAGPLQREGQSSPQTRNIEAAGQLPYLHDILRNLGFETTATPLNMAFPLALLACFGVWILIWRTRWGYALRALGHSEPAAIYAGISTKKMVVAAMLISGGLAGCMAVNEILGAQHKMVLNFPAGYGFTGIAVALMGRTHPLGIVLASLLFGALYQGGAELDFEFKTITREMVLLIQGLIILFSGALALMFVPWISWAFRKE